MTSLIERYGNWALITGAAREEGLGFTFARQLAAQGINLVLVDILEAELNQRAETLRQQHNVEVRPVTLDLSDTNFAPALEAHTHDIEVGLLVCNHMYTPADTPEILDMELVLHHRMLDINARAYTTLMHVYGRQMRARKRGGIIVIASGAGVVSAPYTGAYSANKAFQIALGEALWYELKGSGVDVLVVIGGLMRTQGDALSEYPQFMMSDTDPVVKEALAKLGKQHRLIPGMINKLFLYLQTNIMTRQRAINTIGDFMAKGLGKK